MLAVAAVYFARPSLGLAIMATSANSLAFGASYGLLLPFTGTFDRIASNFPFFSASQVVLTVVGIVTGVTWLLSLIITGLLAVKRPPDEQDLDALSVDELANRL